MHVRSVCGIFEAWGIREMEQAHRDKNRKRRKAEPSSFFCDILTKILLQDIEPDHRSNGKDIATRHSTSKKGDLFEDKEIGKYWLDSNPANQSLAPKQ